MRDWPQIVMIALAGVFLSTMYSRISDIKAILERIESMILEDYKHYRPDDEDNE